MLQNNTEQCPAKAIICIPYLFRRGTHARCGLRFMSEVWEMFRSRLSCVVLSQRQTVVLVRHLLVSITVHSQQLYTVTVTLFPFMLLIQMSVN